MTDEVAMSQPPWMSGPFPYQDPTALTKIAVKELDEQIKLREKSLQDLLESKLAHVKDVHQQKFEGIKTQFANNEISLQNAFTGNKNLIDAQNKANTDAAKKAEEAFKEQINALTTFMNATFDSQKKSIDELKSALSTSQGAAANSNKIMSLIALAAAVISVVYAIGFAHLTSSANYAPVVAAPAVVPVQPK